MKKRTLCADSTIAVLERKKGNLTFRKLAEEFGYRTSYAATLSGVLSNKPGAISADGENVLRAKLGLEPISRITVWPCLTWGCVHSVGDCKGQPGIPVWRKAKPIKSRKRNPRVDIDCTPDEAESIKQLTPRQRAEAMLVYAKKEQQ